MDVMYVNICVTKRKGVICLKLVEAVHKGNGREFIVKMDGKKISVFDVEKKIEREITLSTIERWYDLKGEIEENPRCIKKDGTIRTDKFRPKLNPEQVKEIREKFAKGMKKSHLAKDYGVSFRTITCIVERLMWKHI